MAKLTSPKISVTFTELGASAVARGEKGVVALIVRDGAVTTPLALTQGAQVPAQLGTANQAYIKRAFLGYVNPPKKVLVYPLGEEEELSQALDWLAAQSFDYLAGPPDCTSEEALELAGWIKSQRLNNGSKCKAVLPNCPADHPAIVNFTGGGMTDGTTVWTTAEYCSRMAGLLAGTPMRISATYAPLPELADCARLTREEADEAVGRGELALTWDGRKVKVLRAVNSLVTTTDGMLDSFKKIKLVEVMDLILTDLSATAADEYVGKFANTYDNKLLLVTAIRGYLMGLEQDKLVQPGFSVDIDVDAQERWLTAHGVDTGDMGPEDIRRADTGSNVFIKIHAKILDAIEDIDIQVEI